MASFCEGFYKMYKILKNVILSESRFGGVKNLLILLTLRHQEILLPPRRDQDDIMASKLSVLK